MFSGTSGVDSQEKQQPMVVFVRKPSSVRTIVVRNGRPIALLAREKYPEDFAQLSSRKRTCPFRHDAEPTERAPRSGSRARVAGFASSDTVPSAAMVSAALAVLSAAHWAFSLALVLVGLLASWLRSGRRVERSVGFFHPFTSDGGGGERVLWCAVREVQSADGAVETVVYTGDDLSGVELARRAADRFGVVLPRPIAVVRLATRHLTRPERYPAFTMLGQAFGSAVCTAEALSLYRPDVFFDTTGHAFGYPLARLAGCRVAAYVHYPAVSTDMIRRVRRRAPAFNNDARVARSALKSTAKLVYYNLFAIMYGLCGKCASVAVCNSSWTQAHVRALWGGDPRVVFPPCDVDALLVAPAARRASDAKYVLSVGQFRPEKDHAMQLRAWAAMKKRVVAEGEGTEATMAKGASSKGASRPRGTEASTKKTRTDADDTDPAARALLRVVGGCRGAADEARLASLRALAAELRIEDSVEFHMDVPFATLRELLAGATAGLHTMVDEHFGICVVEYMAAGAVPVAHASAGPAMDIVVPAFKSADASMNDDDGCAVGFLASTEAEYAACMLRALRMHAAARDATARRARARAARFGEERFADGLRAALAGVFQEMDARDKRRKDLRDVVAQERIARTPSPRKGRARGSASVGKSPTGVSPVPGPPGPGIASPRSRRRREATDGGKSPLKPKRL